MNRGFLIITDSCDGVGIGWQLMGLGYDVKLFILNPYYRAIYKNIIPQVATISEGLKNNPVIISDMTGHGNIPEKLKAQGYAVIGAGMGFDKLGRPLNDIMEEDRNWAFEFIEDHGINTSDWHFFPGYKEAIKFVGKSSDRWVCKPLGEGGTALTFPSKNNEELAAFLEKVGKEGQVKQGLILQKFVEGTEVSVEVFCSGGKYVDNSVDSTLETKRFQNDNKGENTGCQSSVCWFHGGKTKLFNESLAKVEEWVSRTKYCGFLDANGIVDKSGNYNWLEWTPRLGYSSWYAISKCIDMDLGEMFTKMAEGTLKELKTRKGFGTAVRATVPPYPFEPPKEPYKGMKPAIASELKRISKAFGGYNAMLSRLSYNDSKDQIVDFDFNDDNCIPIDMYYDTADGQFKTAGTHGIVLEHLAYGDTIESSSKANYEGLERVSVANVRYRTDMAENARKRYDELKKVGYL